MSDTSFYGLGSVVDGRRRAACDGAGQVDLSGRPPSPDGPLGDEVATPSRESEASRAEHQHRRLARSTVLAGSVASLAVGAIMGGLFQGVPVHLPARTAASEAPTVSPELVHDDLAGTARSALAGRSLPPARRAAAAAKTAARSSVRTLTDGREPSAPAASSVSEAGHAGSSHPSVPSVSPVLAPASPTSMAASCQACSATHPVTSTLPQDAGGIPVVGNAVSVAAGVLATTAGAASAGISYLTGGSAEAPSSLDASSPTSVSSSIPASSTVPQDSGSAPVDGAPVSRVTSTLGSL